MNSWEIVIPERIKSVEIRPGNRNVIRLKVMLGEDVINPYPARYGFLNIPLYMIERVVDGFSWKRKGVTLHSPIPRHVDTQNDNLKAFLRPHYLLVNYNGGYYSISYHIVEFLLYTISWKLNIIRESQIPPDQKLQYQPLGDLLTADTQEELCIPTDTADITDIVFGVITVNGRRINYNLPFIR